MVLSKNKIKASRVEYKLRVLEMKGLLAIRVWYSLNIVREYELQVMLRVKRNELYWTYAFDGDEMNVTLLDSLYLVEKFKRLDPTYNVMDTNTPHGISGNLKMPAPVIATIANWMHHHGNIV